MKTTIKLFFFAAIISLFASCAKNPEKLLVKKDGIWTATAVTTIPGLGTYTDISEATFTDGSGTMKDIATGDITNFTWSYDKDAEQITITMVDGSDVTVMKNAVSEIEKDSEKWTFVSGTLNGVAFTTADFTQVTTLVRK